MYHLLVIAFFVVAYLVVGFFVEESFMRIRCAKRDGRSCSHEKPHWPDVKYHFYYWPTPLRVIAGLLWPLFLMMESWGNKNHDFHSADLSE